MLNEHPDEGTIHAWLDGELGPEKSSELAAHVAGCVACQAATGEARGLIAGATRVVRAMEPVTHAVRSSAEPGRDMPWGVLSAPTAAQSSIWRALRVTPARAAIAATLLVVAGIALTRGRVAQDSTTGPHPGASSSFIFSSSPAAASPAAGARDPLLDSAIARNIAKAIPPRTLERADGSSVPVAPPSPVSPMVVDAAAPMQVAAARRSLQVRSDTTAAVADNVAIRGMSSRSGRLAAGASVDAASLAGRPADVNVATLPGQCLRVESGSAGARWGMVPLPFIVVLGGTDVDHGTARIMSESAPESATMATWRRQNADSVHIELRRLGYTGMMQLAVAGNVRGGVMRSAPSGTELNEVVVTGAGDVRGQAAPATATATAPATAPATATAPAPASRAMGTLKSRQTAAPAAAGPAAAGGEEVGVVARRVQCP
jgi:hypothetical protein